MYDDTADGYKYRSLRCVYRRSSKIKIYLFPSLIAQVLLLCASSPTSSARPPTFAGLGQRVIAYDLFASFRTLCGSSHPAKKIRHKMLSITPFYLAGNADEPKKKINHKEFSNRDSHMVTHCSTNRSIRCLFSAERTGCEIFIVLWPNTTSPFVRKFIRRAD